MSSFLTLEHLKVMLGQESRLEKAWADYYGLEILSRGMIILPFAIEQFYPHTQATEWELAVLRMIISCSSLQDGPVASFEAKEFAGRFRLSLRQISRKFKAMQEKGLITITPCYDENGRKTRAKFYDCNLFLDKIFTCLCADDDWHRQQSELLEAIGIDDEDIDDLDMLATIPTLSSTYDLAPAATDLERTSMSPEFDPRTRTSMSPELDQLTRTSMSPEPDPRTQTSMSPENSTSYVRAHTRALDSNSNSINTCINTLSPSSSSNSNSNSNSEIYVKTLSSNSNSNSNSKHDTFQFFDAEDDHTWTITTCADEQQDGEDVSISLVQQLIKQADKTTMMHALSNGS